MRHALAFEHVLTSTGLRHDVGLSFDPAGRIVSVHSAGGGPYDGFLALPGMPNAHSHAFQRALAGAGERRLGDENSFWTWRDAMYSLANRITPEQMYAVAGQAFADMLRGGFTSVAEFHYLHRLPDGSPSAEMGDAVVRAADEVGIRLVLLPVFYHSSGFEQNGQPSPPLPEQGRFAHTGIQEFCDLLRHFAERPCGIAAHSLRAVPPRMLRPLLDGSAAVLGPHFPVHIHIAEQPREVEECQRAFGRRPVELLAGKVSLGERWSLVHATHATGDELARVRASGANVVLCPLTEAYLADGVFAVEAHMRAGGSVAIGTDSNQRIDAVEELRLLEYGQRLVSGQRGRLAGEDGLGAPLWQAAARGGARALREPVGVLAPGHAADIVVLDAGCEPLRGVRPDRLCDALITSGSASCVADVYVGGRRVVAGGALVGGDRIGPRFERAMRALWQS